MKEVALPTSEEAKALEAERNAQKLLEVGVFLHMLCKIMLNMYCYNRRRSERSKRRKEESQQKVERNKL